MNDYDIRERLTPLTKDGNYGNLFDNTKDKFGTGSFQVFEMEELMQRKDIVATTLAYMFHKIEQQTYRTRTSINCIRRMLAIPRSPYF